MAKRRTKTRKVTRRKAVQPARATRQGMIGVAERAVLSRANEAMKAATARYNRLMQQAAAATTDANKKKYLAAALTAVVVAGVVANDLKRRLDKRPVKRKKRQ